MNLHQYSWVFALYVTLSFRKTLLHSSLLKCPGKYHFVICFVWLETCSAFAHSLRLPVCGGGQCCCLIFQRVGNFFFNKVTGHLVLEARNLSIFVNYHQPL